MSIIKLSLLSIGTIGVCYLLGVAALYAFQEKLIFPGDSLPQDFNFQTLPNVSETRIAVEGAELSARHYQHPAPRGLIFFLHGNAGNLETWIPDIDFYQRERYDLFMIDYRGYGKSTGQIRSQAQLEADVLRSWQHIAKDYQRRQLPIVIYGRSIGTYLATRLATQVEAALLVLVSPYTSVTALAQRAFPWVPSKVLRYPLAIDNIIAQVSMPILLLHGAKDRLIPPSHSRTLHGKAPESKLVIVERAGHNDIHDYDLYKSTLARALPE